MGKTVAKQIERHYRQLLARHGITDTDADKALDYMKRGYSNQAAMKLVRANGDHRVLIEGRV